MELMHITITAQRDQRLPLFVGESVYREALHRLGAVCQGSLALFALVAEHLHLIALAGRAAAGRLAQAAALTLTPVLATALGPSFIREVESRAHMRRLLRYILEQPIKHQMPGHPALWIGSCLADLVGARLIEGLSLRIADALPEYRQATALAILGLPGSEIQPAERAVLLAAGPQRLVRIAEAALAASPGLAGMAPPERRARRAIMQLAHALGISRAETAGALGMRGDSARRLARTSRVHGQPRDDETLLAIARRLTLEQRVASALRDTPARAVARASGF